MEENWTGGYFTLVVRLGVIDAGAARSAFAALWRHGSLRGCYAEVDFGLNGSPQEPSELELGVYIGRAILPRGQVVCRAGVLNYPVDGWVAVIYLPMAALGDIYPVGAYPFEDASGLEWRDEVSDWLRGIAASLFAERPFPLGLVGWEADDHDLAELTDAIRREGIPAERWEGLLWTEGGFLQWYPPNRGAPMRVP